MYSYYLKLLSYHTNSTTAYVASIRQHVFKEVQLERKDDTQESNLFAGRRYVPVSDLTSYPPRHRTKKTKFALDRNKGGSTTRPTSGLVLCDCGLYNIQIPTRMRPVPFPDP